MESLWHTKSHSKGAPCMVIERSLSLHQHPYSSWQGANSKKERLIQTANSTRPHFVLFSGSVWTTVITSCCFSFHFHYPFISNLSICFLLSKTEPVSNSIPLKHLIVLENQCIYYKKWKYSLNNIPRRSSPAYI